MLTCCTKGTSKRSYLIAEGIIKPERQPDCSVHAHAIALPPCYQLYSIASGKSTLLTCGQEAVWVQGVGQLSESLLLRGACGIGHDGPHQVFQRGGNLVQPGSLQAQSAM